jgi:CotH protein/lamin tail-like protein/chitobiase/beta-hexosaminidase-like protein/K319-like protein/Fn3 domain-containing protein
LLACFAAWVVPLQAQVTISEFMASNNRTLADEDGEFPDWIEIYNDSNASVNLAGWSLTEDSSLQDRWFFPGTNLPPKGFIVVFASGKNRIQPGSPLHTDFSLNADGEYLALIKSDGATIATEFAPQFPEQFADISYGIGQNATTNSLLAAGSSALVLIPSSGTLGATWTSIGFNDSSWTGGATGIGYETAVPGFAVRNIKANILVDSLAAAEGVINNPAQQAGATSENAPVINYFGTGGDGHYGNNAVFPGHSVGADIDDFVVEVTATVTIPVAGNWTFGVNSDDGFGLTVGSSSMSFPDPRGPDDTLSVFNFPAPGDYALRLVFYERGGGSALELFAAQGNFVAWNSTNFRLVGDAANGGLAVKSLPVSGGGSGSYRSLIGVDVQTQMKGVNASAYIRVPFNVSSPNTLESLTLRMKYDDGFIGYLNGQEVARRNAPASPQWNSAASASHPNDQALVYEDINISGSLNLLQAGSNVLAIHGLNENANDTDFLILPGLVEYEVLGLTNHYFSTPTPGSINSTGFLAFVADTKFSHDRGFYETAFSLSITTATATATIRYTTNGTPPSLTNGFTYAGPINITGTRTVRAAAFKDGFEPSNTDTHTYIFLSDVIQQSPTGAPPPGWPSSWGGNVVDYGMDPTVVNNPAYSATIKDDLKTIPTFSIVMDLNDLFDPSIGIYANPGQDGIAWERPASVELIYPDGTTEGFQIDAGIRIRGGFSRSTSNPKHAFRLFFRQQYGTPKLRYAFFGDNGTDTFDGIDLRTFQNYSWSFQGDSRGVFLRDQFCRDAQLAMGHQSERGNFYHLYVNGQYWGLFNTCERPEASYGETYFGGRKEDYDVIKVEAGPYAINATDGNLDAWTRLYNAALAGLASDDAYMRIQGKNADGTPNPAYENLVDVPNLIDYMLVILYGGNLDAPISNFLGNTRPNNWYGVRNRVGPDGFRFFVHDAEHTLLNLSEDRTGPYPAGDTSVVYSSPQWIWQKLQANAEFRMLVADHVHRHFFNNGVLTSQGANALFVARKNEIDRAVVGESARWGDAKREPAFTRTDWLNAINAIVNSYLPQRSGIVLNQLRADGLYPNVTAPSFFQFGGHVGRGFNLFITAPAGTIYYTLDGTDPRLRGGGFSASARSYGGPVVLTESARVRARVLSGGVWSALTDATFYVIQNFTELLITEIMYNPPGTTNYDGDAFEFIELKNVASTELELSGVKFTNGINYVFPLGTKLSPGAFAVLVSDPVAFQLKYPTVPISGVYTGRLSNGGERVDLVHAVGTPIVSMSYGDRAPWPPSADGIGFSLVPVNPNLNPNPDDPANWRSSLSAGGSPGADDPPSNLPRVWINEVLTHTDPPQLDAIELHNPGPTTADISGWYLTDQRSQPKKFRIPNATIPPGESVVFDELDFNPNPGVEPSFNLSSHGEQVYLYSADTADNLTGYSDGFSFGAAQNGVSFGRYTTSIGEVDYPAQFSNTLSNANTGPRIGPVVINEIRYHPASGDDEFVELKNITASPVKLYDPNFPTNTWQLNGLGFSFPTNTEIGPNGLMLLVSIDAATFRTKYSVPAGVPIFTYPGALQDNGESLQLERPDAPDVDTNGTVIVPYFNIDLVRYDNSAPWPTNAAGLGPSLERLNASAYGNDPINWRASPGGASPGLENTGNRIPLVNAGADRTVQSSTFPLVINLSATVSDDGQPNPPGALTVAWTQVGGPGAVIFGSPSQAATTASFPGVGTYVLRLAASDSVLQAEDDLTVVVQRAAMPATFVTRGSTWKYLDNGTDRGTNWYLRSFNDSTWASGPAPLGYNDTHIVTAVSYGPVATDKYITTYFRRSFTLSNASSVTALAVNVMRDDGAVVYLNNEYIFKSNMPESAIDFRTLASVAVGVPDETAFFSWPVDPTLLLNGTNVLAVEIHQSGTNSSDLGFDLELTGLAYPPNQAPLVSAGGDLTITLPASGSLNGSASDDGLPIPPGQLSVIWSKFSGPGTVTFANASAANTTATFSSAGAYVLRLTANDGAVPVSDDVSVTVNGGGQPELRVDSIQVTSATPPVVRIGFTAVAGQSYTVQYCDSLTGGIWIRLTDLPASGSTQIVEVTDNGMSALTTRYYRIVTPLQP